MTLRSPIRLEPGTCGCSSDGTSCMCMPTDMATQLSALTDARYQIDAATTPEQRAHWTARRNAIGEKLRASEEYRTDAATATATPSESRADRDLRALNIIERYKGVPARRDLEVEVAARSDAYRNARLDEVLKSESFYERWAIADSVTEAGDAAVRAHAHRTQAYRADGGEVPAWAVPRINWPPGYDREKALAELRAESGLPILGKPDHWICAAIMALLDRRYSASQLAAAGAEHDAYLAWCKRQALGEPEPAPVPRADGRPAGRRYKYPLDPETGCVYTPPESRARAHEGDDA